VADNLGQRATGDLPPAGFQDADAELAGQARQIPRPDARRRVGNSSNSVTHRTANFSA
jgi:hypothetical protein